MDQNLENKINLKNRVLELYQINNIKILIFILLLILIRFLFILSYKQNKK